jgi:type I restriction enzyme, S subunit
VGLPFWRKITFALTPWLLPRVGSSRQRLENVPKLLKRFRQAILSAACSGRLTARWRVTNPTVTAEQSTEERSTQPDIQLPKPWKWMLSARAFDFVTSGSRGWAKYYSDAGPIFLRIGNLNHDSINLDLESVQRVSPPASAEGRRTKVSAGDILISITADVGMIALVEDGLEEAYINQHIALGRPVGNMNRRYLAYYLSAKDCGQRQFQSRQRGATKVGLGLEDIRSIWIAQPPIAEQEEIVRRVEALFALSDRLEVRLKTANAQAEGLNRSILAKAFRGELVRTEAELAAPEGREFETAEQLLVQISTSRVNKTSAPKARPRDASSRN